MDFSISLQTFPLSETNQEDTSNCSLSSHTCSDHEHQRSSKVKNLPWNLAHILNSESEEPELNGDTRASSPHLGTSSSTKNRDSSRSQANGSSIMKITSQTAIHDPYGLMTPETLENSSPLVNTALTIDESLSHDLEFDARKSALISKRINFPWNELKEALFLRLKGTAITKGEMDLIVHEWQKPGQVDFELLKDECFARSAKEIEGMLSKLSASYKKFASPNLLLISTLETCIARREFLRSEVLKYISNDMILHLQELLPRRFRRRPFWLQREEEFVSHAVKNDYSMKEMQRELVFRTPGQIEAKVESLSQKMHNTRADEAKMLHGKAEYYMSNDLTYSAVSHAIDVVKTDLLIKAIRNAIEEMGGSQMVPFTKGELDYLREIVNKEYSMETIQKELIFREEEEIRDKLKLVLITCLRKKKFSSSVDRLVYEAEWYASMGNTDNGGSRRSRHRPSTRSSSTRGSDAVVPKHDAPHTQKQESLKNRREVIEQAALKRKDTMRRKREERQKFLQKINPHNQTNAGGWELKRRLRSKEKSSLVDSLLADATWFQSVTGDGSEVKEGQKRIRKRASHFVPEFESRQKIKRVKRKLEDAKAAKAAEKKTAKGKRNGKVRKQKLRPGKRGRGRPRREEYTDDSEAGTDSELDSESESDTELGNEEIGSASPQHLLEEEVSEEEEEEPSPFEPTNVLNDTLVPLKGRRFFNKSILNLALMPENVKFTEEALMLESTDEVPFSNLTAVDVVKSHARNYRSLPDSFPPLTIRQNDEDIVNPNNIVRVRHLLYPQHTDAFILALPKSNELNPLLEIQKMIQIHAALYFSYSPELQEYIFEEYCQKLKQAVDNNKFNQFMILIDRWNLLMLELTPYALECDPSDDINPEARLYLPFNYRKNHSESDLNLEMFFTEIINKGQAIKQRGRKPLRQLDINEANGSYSEIRLSSETPTGVASIKESTDHANVQKHSSRFSHLRPANYSFCLLRLLKSQRAISRYAVQQILNAAYSRIVGPNSRKLRSYKAFTAEVYGELLPSFISEVFTKVGLKPLSLFYDLGSGVGNTTFQAALEFGVKESGGCEIMSHASNLTSLQTTFLEKKLQVWGLHPLNITFALSQSFVNNNEVRKKCLNCDVILVNNYLFEFPLNVEVGKLLYGLKPGSKIISLKNFIPPRYKAGSENTVLDYLKVEKFEMSDFYSVSWTANKVPYYISTVQRKILPDYL